MTAIARRRVRAAVSVPSLLVTATILTQVAYPLAGGAARTSMTAAVVLFGAAAAVAHAAAVAGARGLTGLAVAAAVGLAAEVVGVRTGVPFGRYAYAGDLGPSVGGVPWLVVAAWVFMAWPAAVVARRVVRNGAARVAVGAWALAAWDVFLDPQMVTAGHWLWRPGGWRLPGIGDVPVSNFVGWLVVAAVISAVLQTVAGRGLAVDPRPMLVFYVWTAASSVLAAAAFWHRPAVAAWGLLAMGPVAVAVLRAWRHPAR